MTSTAEMAAVAKSGGEDWSPELGKRSATTAAAAVASTVVKSVGEAWPSGLRSVAFSAVAPTVAKFVGEAPPSGFRSTAPRLLSAVFPTVVKSVGEARLLEIAKCRVTTVFERTSFNGVLLSMTVVPIPGGCALS